MLRTAAPPRQELPQEEVWPHQPAPPQEEAEINTALQTDPKKDKPQGGQQTGLEQWTGGRTLVGFCSPFVLGQGAFREVMASCLALCRPVPTRTSRHTTTVPWPSHAGVTLLCVRPASRFLRFWRKRVTLP